MSPSGKVLYRHGNYGHTVKVVQRDRGTLVLRFTKTGGGETDKALGHHDLRRAQQQARELSRQLSEVRASESGAPGARDGMTVQELFARYAVTVSAHKKGAQPHEDERRRVLWLAFFANGAAGAPATKRRVKNAPEGEVALAFGPTLRASAVTPAHVKLFIAMRAAGAIVVDGLKLQKQVKPRTVDADVVWLLSVYNWAYNEARLLKLNPLRGTKRPDVVSQLRPMATRERAAKLEAVAAQVHPRFPLLLACIRYLGWRITAVCELRGSNFDRQKTKQAPYGRIRKDWQTDKEGAGGWLPMPKALRAAFDEAKVVGNALLFPSPKVPKKPMSRSYARDLLERAEKLAKLAPLEGGDWHPYRRLWATERKSLPTGDVMLAGDWQDERTIRKYQLADPETIKQVMFFDPTETQTASASGATSGTPKPKTQRRGGRVSA